jgi:hypothetical protein
MSRIIVPITDPFSSHRLAALRVQELRRKGVHCHIQGKADEKGHYLEVMLDPPGQPAIWQQEARERLPRSA